MDLPLFNYVPAVFGHIGPQLNGSKMITSAHALCVRLPRNNTLQSPAFSIGNWPIRLRVMVFHGSYWLGWLSFDEIGEKTLLTFLLTTRYQATLKLFRPTQPFKWYGNTEFFPDIHDKLIS